MRHCRLEILVNGNLSPSVGLQACGIDVHLIAVRLPPDGVQQALPVHVLSAFQLGENAITPIVESHGHDFLTQAKNRAQLTQLKTETLDDFPIREIQKDGSLVEQGYLHAQSGKHRGVFETNNAGADDDQVPWHLLEFVQLIGIKNALSINGDVIAVRGPGSAGHQYVLSANQMGSLIATYLDGVRIEEPRLAFEGGHVIPA